MIGIKRTKKEIMANIPAGGVVSSKVIDNNTVRYTTTAGDNITRLHLTDIITTRKNGDMVLNSGGWLSRTTNDRINKYAPGVRIRQNKGVWHVRTSSGDESIFYDGITIKKSGRIIKKKVKDDQAGLKKQVKEYCAAVKALDVLPEPSGGDCWHCLMFDQEGEKSSSIDHLINHLEEKYIHGSLIINALKYAGHQNPGFILQYDYRDIICRAVAKYFKDNLGIAR